MNRATIVAFSLLAAIAQTCTAATAPNSAMPGTTIKLPPQMSFKKSSISDNYLNTSCIEITEQTEGKIGLICTSADKALLDDFGVSLAQGAIFDVKTLAKEEIDLRVATGMSSYDMRPIKLGSRQMAYAAETDCDQNDGPVYRATSTCHVAVYFLPGGRFIYSNLVIENHINKKKILKDREVNEILESIVSN